MNDGPRRRLATPRRPRPMAAETAEELAAKRARTYASITQNTEEARRLMLERDAELLNESVAAVQSIITRGRGLLDLGGKF